MTAQNPMKIQHTVWACRVAKNQGVDLFFDENVGILLFVQMELYN
jgi:hypothetical protein